MTMPTLHLLLLGDFSLHYDDQQVTSLNTKRLRSLPAYLVLHRDVPKQRQHLAFLFWPDATCSHQTQLLTYHLLARMSEEQHKALWDFPSYDRAFSVVNGGRQVENDMFEGLQMET